MIWTALAIWLAASIIATGLVARLFNVSAQSDDHTADDLAESERAVDYVEFQTFHKNSVNR